MKPDDGEFGSNPTPSTQFYREVWSEHGNMIRYCESQEELDKLVKDLLEIGWTKDQFFILDNEEST